MKITVATIGAGLSAISFANELSKHPNFEIKLFDKANRPGGRSCSRLIGEREWIDHGAQYFTIRSSYFREMITPLQQRGVVAEWKPRIASYHAQSRDSVLSSELQKQRFVGCPSMGHLALELAKNLDIRTNTQIDAIRTGMKKPWSLFDQDAQCLGDFDIVVITLPPEQAERLVCSIPELSSTYEVKHLYPCWALMVQFEQKIELQHEAIYFKDDAFFSWIARDSSKPGRTEKKDCWVIHANENWSQVNLEADKNYVAEVLFEAFCKRFDLYCSKLNYRLDAHRWRYSKAQTCHSQRFMLNRDLMIGFCGDSYAGSRVEGAILSGAALAKEIATIHGI